MQKRIRTGKDPLFESSWTAPAVREMGLGKHAKWVLFRPHQLQKLARQNMQ
jgi:hypothetical protein